MFTGKFSQNSQENRLLSDLIIPLLFILFERLPLLVHGLCERVFEALSKHFLMLSDKGFIESTFTTYVLLFLISQ